MIKTLLKKIEWRRAQKGEERWWREWLKENPSANDDDWIGTVLRYFELEEGKDFGRNSVLVDIGSGPIGLLTKLKAKERIAVDPLGIESFDKTIIRIKAPGESIPLEDEKSDCVFIYNVLQHVRSPEKVLKEAMRILKTDGQLYLLEQLNLPTDKLHPNSLKLEMFDAWLAANNYKVIKKTKEDDCYFDHPHKPGSGYAVLCLIVTKN